MSSAHGRITHGCLGPLFRRQRGGAGARASRTAKRIGTAKIGIQLAHAGRKASAQRPWEGGGPLKAGARSVADHRARRRSPFGDNWHTPREATADDIARVREAFVDSAKRAVRIGFDLIELHYRARLSAALRSSRRCPTSAPTTTAARWRTACGFRCETAQAVRAVVPKRLAARRAHHRQRLARRRADAGRRRDVRQGAEGRRPRLRRHVVGRHHRRHPQSDRARLQRADRRAGQARGRHRDARGRPDRRRRSRPRRWSPKARPTWWRMARAMLDDPHWGWHAAQALGAEVRAPAAISARRRRSCGRAAARSITSASSSLEKRWPCLLRRAVCRACHAGWNARSRSGSIRLSTTVLIAIGAGAGRAAAAAVRRHSAAGGLAVADRLGRHPSVLFRRR